MNLGKLDVVKQEMARINIDILGVSEPKWMGMVRLQYFGHLMRREDSLEKTLMLGKCEDKKRRGRQRTRWLDRVIEATNMNLMKLREAVDDRRAWRALIHGVTKSRTRLNE